jgi:protein phosphatase
MATTMVMACQLPQKIATTEGTGNSHEIYIAHVGDSRAYWLTRKSCQLLTVDDDVAQREIKQGKSMPWQAQGRIDAGSLTQALGTKTGADLTPMIQRLIVVEDGVLLLCSDGLSDRQLIEKSWQNYVPQILDNALLLDQAVRDWIQQASQDNGHDNISLVLMSCQVTPSEVFAPEVAATIPAAPAGHWLLHLLRRFILLELLLGGIAIGLIATYLTHPQWFQQLAPRPPAPALPSPVSIPDVPTTPQNNNSNGV